MAGRIEPGGGRKGGRERGLRAAGCEWGLTVFRFYLGGVAGSWLAGARAGVAAGRMCLGRRMEKW